MTGAGLCDSCVHEKIVRSRHNNVFVLCSKSKDDPSFPRYPPLPVRTCPGHETKDEKRGESQGSGSP